MIKDFKQEIQEKKYFLPYHWFITRDSFEGREYFGYLDLILEYLGKDLTGQKILDAGCGDGRMSFEISKKSGEIFGIDYSKKAINFAKILAPKVKFLVSDIKKTPFATAFFDKIILVEVLEHIPPKEIPSVLKELKRILKKNGEIILTVPTKLRPLIPKHHQHFSENQIKEILKDFFKIKKIIGQDKKSFLFKNLYRLFENRFWQIKPLSKFFNLYLYPKYLKICHFSKANRFIVICKKLDFSNENANNP